VIAIVDSGGANLGSVLFALARIGASAVVTADPEVIRASDRVILPGVGAAGAAMRALRERDLVGCLRGLTQPVLGICLGMQLLYEHSDEGDTRCLGVLPGNVQRLAPRAGFPVPHMGWNTVTKAGTHAGRPSCPLLTEDDAWFYFVHSFAAPAGDAVVAVTDHGGVVPAVVASGNWFGAQFHPERSGAPGERFLRKFLER
jgi:glutamine amidotransferase